MEQKIDWKKVSNSSGYKKLKASVIHDIHDRGNRQSICHKFSPTGCNKKRHEYVDGRCYVRGCSHAYCNKFKWIIDRAKHYSYHLGIPLETVLDTWEKDRGYWYMNYYQDGNQPKITGIEVKVFETVEDFQKTVANKGFRCPRCGGVSKNPQTCTIGKLMSKNKKCDWKSYGLFGHLGKGITVYIKTNGIPIPIFKPIVYEKSLSQ